MAAPANFILVPADFPRRPAVPAVPQYPRRQRPAHSRRHPQSRLRPHPDPDPDPAVKGRQGPPYAICSSLSCSSDSIAASVEKSGAFAGTRS